MKGERKEKDSGGFVQQTCWKVTDGSSLRCAQIDKIPLGLVGGIVVSLGCGSEMSGAELTESQYAWNIRMDWIFELVNK